MSLGDIRSHRAAMAAALSLGLTVGGVGVAGVASAAPPTFVMSEGVGDSGPAVEVWQDRLNEWLRLTGDPLYPIVVDGEFGPQTETATRAFQRANSAVVNDGTVDDDDRIALEAAISTLEATAGDEPAAEPSAEPADDATDDDEVVGDGSATVADGADETMVWWQVGLNEWLELAGSDLYPIVVDGEFGPQTETATREFQATYATLDVDGTVDPIDRVVLEDAIDALEGGAGLPAASSEEADDDAAEEAEAADDGSDADDEEVEVASGGPVDAGVDGPTTSDDVRETVRWWQDRLNDWLDLVTSTMFPIVVDGWFGPQTETATREFQATEDALDVDGRVDQVDRVVLDQAIDELEAGGAADTPVSTGDGDLDGNPATDGNTVADGSVGDLVTWWQAGLNEWLLLTENDLYPIVVDGDFGPQTETATRVFQAATDGIDVDGSVDDADRVALENAIAALDG